MTDSHNPLIEAAGEPLTLATLPPADTTRWVARRKAQVVAAVETGLLSIEEACRRYRLSIEEYVGWRRALVRFGLRGLQIGQLQARKTERRPGPQWKGHPA